MNNDNFDKQGFTSSQDDNFNNPYSHQQPPNGFNPHGYPPPHQHNPYGQQPMSAQNIDNSGQVIFSVINMVLFGFIFGLIALIFALNAKNEPTYEQGLAKLRVAKILNIVGVSIGAVLVFAIFFIFCMAVMMI
ncbi:MAG: hypothetical protein FWE13_00435 [Firmicutes bacterium]|nr:hypothetical protein [Bacillota bacterium]